MINGIDIMEGESLKDFVDRENLKYHHQAMEKGYICIKTPNGKRSYVAEPYKGRFGEGYKIHVAGDHCREYHNFAYYIREERRP